MKKHLTQLFILIPLLFTAGIVMAAYSFVPPTTAPDAGNTEAPIDTSITDQIKHGGLAVNAFNVQGGAYFAQQVSFADTVQGGAPGVTSSTINFGDTSHQVSVQDLGSTSIIGNYQSDSLKSGGGLKPVCADTNGAFFLCGGSQSVTQTTSGNQSAAILTANYQSMNGSTYVSAKISQPVAADNVVVTFSYILPSSTAAPSALNYIKNNILAEAAATSSPTDGTDLNYQTSNPFANQQVIPSGGGGTSAIPGTTTTTQPPVGNAVCKANSTPKVLGTVTIPFGSTVSEAIPLPDGCDPSAILVFISSFDPHLSGGTTITSQ